jgi:anti-sigma regulatory factor (Ser/Thr protein kinase)
MHIAQPPPSLTAVFPAQPGRVSQIRHAVKGAATGFGADEDVVMHVGLAVSEAVTNAILHAYRDGREGDDLHITVRGDADGLLEISVRDHGVGMRPRHDSPGLGLGLSLMAHEADRFEIRQVAGGGTEIILRFALSVN